MEDKKEPINFDEWCEINDDKITLELAENGADREMDFDREIEFLIRYNKYLNQFYNYE